MNDAILINENDDVYIALHDLKKGTVIQEGIVLLEDIKQAHKIARYDLKKGHKVIKYGAVIGVLTQDVKKGSWIHSHNLKTTLEGEFTYTYHKNVPTNLKASNKTFMGYVRKDGRVGIRNDLYIVPTVGCVNSIINEIRMRFILKHPDMVHSVKVATHPYGCSQLGDDFTVTKVILQGLAINPNAGGTLVVGLGCENNRLKDFMETMPKHDEERMIAFQCQDVENEIDYGVMQLEKLYNKMVKDVRTECGLCKLVLGLKCGGSDGFSGITANPLLGRVSEIIGASGGKVLLTEVPEMFGAEQFLMNRAKDEKTFNKVVDLINNFKAYYKANHQVCYENPSPGNKDGGITTLEEKSLGCIQKAGHMEVEDTLDYGQQVRVNGLSLVNGPGNDIVAGTNIASSNATLLCFTTGRGTPYGSIIPTIKIGTNHRLSKFKSDWIDFDAQVVFDEGFEKATEQLLDYILSVCSGKLTKADENGNMQIAIFKQGVTL